MKTIQAVRDIYDNIVHLASLILYILFFTFLFFTIIIIVW